MKRLLLPAILLAPLSAQAGWNEIDAASLDYNRYDTIFNTEGDPHETRVTTLGLTLVEPAYRWVYGGLRFGYLDVSQDGNPATAGTNMNGGYFGVLLGVPFVDTDHFELTAQVEYNIYLARDEIDTQDTELEWTDAVGRLGAAFKYGTVRISAGAFQHYIDGEQVRSGAVNDTARFEHDEDDANGTYAGIEFYLDRTGRIGIHAEQGARDGVMLTFTREF